MVIADITGFTRFVRDTPTTRVVRDSLAAFYSKARYQIIHSGGMVLQFVGDSVVALFGVPRARRGYVEAALDCAEMMLSIGDSVVTEWQRQIDHVQPASGAHVGIALGDLQLLSLRPFGAGAAQRDRRLDQPGLAHDGARRQWRDPGQQRRADDDDHDLPAAAGRPSSPSTSTTWAAFAPGATKPPARQRVALPKGR